MFIKILVSQPSVSSQCLLPFLEISNEIRLLFLKDLVEDILAVYASLQGRAVDLPHLVLADRQSPDLIVGLPLDDLSGEELIQNGIQVGRSLDQLSHVFIHKVLDWGRTKNEKVSHRGNRLVTTTRRHRLHHPCRMEKTKQDHLCLLEEIIKLFVVKFFSFGFTKAFLTVIWWDVFDDYVKKQQSIEERLASPKSNISHKEPNRVSACNFLGFHYHQDLGPWLLCSAELKKLSSPDTG